MGSHKMNELTEALEGLIPSIEKLTSIDIDGAIMDSLSKEDREEVEKFKKSSDVVKKAEKMAKDFNSKTANK